MNKLQGPAQALLMAVAALCPLSMSNAQTPVIWDAGSSTNFNWNDPLNWSTDLLPVASDDLLFLLPVANPGALPNPQTLSLSLGDVANSLSFFTSYQFTGGSLALTSGGIRVTRGELLRLGSKLTGSGGLTVTGGGAVRLSNNANDYTGTTTIADGSLIITNESALGAEATTIVVTGYNPVFGSTNLRGFGGGSLVLDGTGGDITISRDLLLQGQGPVADRGGALISTGNNTLAGLVTTGAPFAGTALNTRIIAADGTLNLTGTLNVLGTAGTTISNFGGVNQAGASFYNITGVLAGTGTLEASGGGTLFLNPTDSSGFSGVIRVSGSAASGQSVVRIDSPGVLGTRTGGTTSAVLDMNGGILAVLMDSPDVKVSNGTNANVYFRAASTIFADHTPNSSVKDQTVAFGNLSYEDGIALTFNSRNGYGMSFTTSPVNGGNGDTTMTNNLQGGALLTFTGNFWSNADNTGNRTMTIGGNGNTLINGSIIASAAAFNHNLTKSGTGTLTITGTASTLDGNVTVSGGTLAINDWRAITNNTSTVNLNGGILSVVGNNVSLANLTTSKVINLSGTTGSATILANQTGTSQGLILNADFTATGAGAKTLTLGGSNIGANTINGAIVQNGTTNVTKVDSGRWVLAGTSTYTGATTISNGTLQLKANAAASTILADTSAITFNSVNVYAGGTLEFVGQVSTANVESLGALTPTNGSGTVKLTPGSGGTASLIFASLGTVGGGGTVNIDTPNSSNTVSFTTTGISNNIANAGLFYNGSDFAFVPGAGLALRAPNYTTDADFATSSSALTASRSMEITGAGFSNAAVIIDSLRINGSTTLTMTGLLTIRTAGTANASGGIIQTGGSGTITGTGVSTGGTGALVINVDGAGNTLTLDAPITSTTTGGFTKVGQGTLRLGAANAQTGTISINEGTVRLAGADRLGAGSAALTIRQDGILELNGVTPATTTGNFNNNGIVRNSSATTDVVFTVGGTNGTGTSLGIIEDGGAGKISLVKLGTGAQSWLGLSTYTGTTTIGSTGIVSINDLVDGGSASGIGASSSAAGNLIFNGASATQAYGGLSYTGTTNDSTDRLFTFDGGASGGARIQSNGVNNATSSWTNTGALAFGPNAAGNAQGLVLGGSSTGDNRFFPIINDNGAAVTSVYKADAGVWYLEAANGYTGATTLTAGTLYATDGVGLPTASNLVFNGGNFAASGSFSRTIGTGGSQIQWTANGAGGFSAGGSKLTVDFGAGNVWGTTPGFLGTGALLLNNSGVAKSEVEIVSSFEITQGIATSFNATTTAGSATVNLTSGTTAGLAIGQTITGNPNIPSGATIATIVSPTQFTLSSGTGVVAATGASTSTAAGGYRQVNVGDFTSIGADFATLSGVISGAGSLSKEGAGILNLRGANTYSGQTLVRQGTLVVESLGDSANPGATSVGDSTLGNTDAGAIALGNGGTTGGILEYVGAGETSDRKIRLNTTTGTNQIHADGVGPLILTNVANDMTAGAKSLSLRGVNQMGNMITSQLSDNGGALSITVDGSAMWILTNSSNNYSGTTAVNAGMLGIGANTALGTGNLDLNNGTIFAFGGDRNITNPVRLVNNTTTAVTGDYNLTFSNPLQLLVAGTTNAGLNNNISAGKLLTFSGVTANSITTANRTWTIDGSGDTFVNGDLTTTATANGGLNLTKTGDGVLILGGSGGGANNFNRNNATVDIDRGTLRLGADEVIGDGVDTQTTPVAYGSLTLSPELANGDTAIFDLNGHTETINGLTANTDGTAIIDNTSSVAASLIFGNNNSAASFGGGTGVYTIQNSGGGPLSITKTGSGVATIPTGVTLTYTGATIVNGGTFNIASPVNGTTALSVTGGSTLALTGGITNPGAITSVEVGGGSILSLLDGAGSQISNLTSLKLGNSGTGTASLNVNIGDLTTVGDGLSTDKLTLLTGGTLALGNTITFNMTDAGLNANTTYTLLSIPDGGLGAFGLTNVIQGATPGGFTSFTWDVQDTYVKITTGTLITGVSYWRGLTDTTWSGNANNWSQDKAGTIAALSIPGQGTDVVFQWDAATNTAVTTTLEQNFKINSLTFEASTTPANTPTAVTINPGVNASSRLEIAPQSATDGIQITVGGPTTVTISAAVKIGKDQTWNVADAGSTLSLGSLFGEADVTKIGAGKVTLTGAADNTFNSGVTSDFTINGGTLEILSSSGLGNTINSNLARIAINSTGAFYYNNATAGTVANQLTLNGGSLSAAGNSQTYSGAVTLSSDSFLNMRDANSAVLIATARGITLSGVISGSGKLTVDSVNTVSSGNQLTGTLVLSNANSSWSGGMLLSRGTVDLRQESSLGTGAVTVQTGRFLFKGAQGTTWSQFGNGLTLDNPGANAVLELQPDNQGSLGVFTTNITGTVTLGSATSPANLRIYHADTLSQLQITGPIVLGNDATIHTSGAGTSGYQPVLIDGVISDSGSGFGVTFNGDPTWGSTNYQLIRLSGANTFTGDFALSAGTLEFSTVSDIGGPASNLGQGTAIKLGSGNLRFTGAVSQSTDRPITTTGAATLSANGTGGATITYNGAITVGPSADGTQFTLSGTAGSEGIITGGITMTGDTADAVITGGGTWTIPSGTSRIADVLTLNGGTTLNLSGGTLSVRNDFVVTGVGTTLNLNTTGVLSYSTATLSADASLLLRDGAVVNLGANDAVVATDFDRLFLGQDADGATPTLNMNIYNLTTSRLILGERSTLRNGNIIGTGTLTVTGGDIDLFEGTISANLASTGTSTFEKFGFGTVTLSGNNTGLTSTGATIVNEGTLVLDYTTNNNDKIRALSQLDMRGSVLQLVGNNSAPTLQSVASFTLGSGGSSKIQLTGGTGQDIVLNLGAITRANGSQDGTLRLVLPSGTQSGANGFTTTTLNTNGLLGASGFATVDDGTGTWFATNATNTAGGNIVALISTTETDVTSWATGEHVTDGPSAYTGLLDCANIASLRFDAAAGSDVMVSPTGVLSVASGGILVTNNVGGTPSIQGGTLAAGVTELIITQDSTQTFEISSHIGINHAVTKSGAGTLLLSGNNNYTDETEIQAGTLQVFGGNAIGDTSIVTLATNVQSTLEILSDETIGRLQGGQRNTNSDYGIVSIGSNTLTINESASTTFAGLFTGSGMIVMNAGSTGNLNMTNLSTGFTGSVVINGGLFQLSGSGQNNASSFTINKSGALLLDNNGSTRSGARILDTTSITLNSADGAFSGQTIIRGLAIRTDQSATTNETIGDLYFNSGASYLSGDTTTTTSAAAIIANNFLRFNNATVDARGRAMGASSGTRNQFRIGTAANETAFIATLVGGGGAAGTKNISIVPWAIGETATANLTDANTGNSLVTYVAGAGFRALNPSTEYNTFAAAAATDNVRESLAADLTGLAGTTLNALVIDNAAVTTLNVSGAGAGNALANTSGTFLFTLTGGAASTAYSTIVSGFDDGITVGSTNEYVFFVVNPSSAATTSQLSVTVGSPLTSVADITKSGRGTLVLTGTNTAGGGTRKTTINEGTLEIASLSNIGGNTGALVFAGGTLRLAAGFADDISQRSISLLSGGGTIDTNGTDLSLANSVGSGIGGLTKVGAGTLTLNAAATYTGPTVISGGTLAIGINNAIGVGGNLAVNAGATLALGSNSVTVGAVTTSGASPNITGTGTINASGGYVFNHTGDTTVDAILAGAGGLMKLQANALTLTGLSTFSGSVEVQAGTLVVSSIENVGVASALGKPTTAQAGVIRMGLTGAATTLSYNGSGSTSDRVVALQGTTGTTTLDADGTGALTLGGVEVYTAGNKTLTLQGSSDPSLANSLGVVDECGLGALALLKTDANTWVLTGTNSYTGATTINNGILRITADQVLTGALNFGSANTITTAGTLDLTSANATFGTLLVQTNSTTETNHLIVGAGKTLTITGNVTIGGNGANSTTLLDTSGGGDLVVNNPTASGVFAVGGNVGTGNKTVADLSGLNSVTINLDPATGTVRVNPVNGTNVADKYSTLILPSTGSGNTTITANTLAIGDSSQNNGAAGQVNTVKLGSGVNTFNVNSLNIGTGSGNRDMGQIVFNAASGSLIVRDATGTGRATFNMGAFVGSQVSTGVGGDGNTFDVTGHNADLLLGVVSIGTQNRGTTLNNTFSFDQGTLDMTSLTMSTRTAESTNGIGLARVTNSTMNLGGGTVIIQNGITSMGAAAGAYGSNPAPVMNATINVTGGDVTIGATAGTAITMASYTATGGTGTGSSNALLNLSGGTTTINGNIVKSTAATTNATATVTLNGGTLDMTGNNIGSATNVVTFNAQAGTLQNLGDLNGGDTLTKTTTGTLILQGNNTYTGGTAINAGVLQVNSANALNGAGTITFGGGTLQYSANNQTDYSSRFSTAAAQAVSIDTNAQSVTFATPLSSSGGTLAKSGAGSLELTTASTYDAGTTVTDGTLLANNTTGSATGSGPVNVTGGALGGTGSVSGTTTVSGNGSITPGTPATNNGIGTLTVSGDLTLSGSVSPVTRLDLQLGLSTDTVFNDAANIQAHIDANDLAAYLSDSGTIATYEAENGTHDRLSIGGSLNLDSGGQILVSSLGYNLQFGDVLDLLDWATIGFNADATGASFTTASDLVLPTLGGGLSYDSSLFATQGIVVVVPEPSKSLLLLVGLCTAALRRRRKA